MAQTNWNNSITAPAAVPLPHQQEIWLLQTSLPRTIRVVLAGTSQVNQLYTLNSLGTQWVSADGLLYIDYEGGGFGLNGTINGVTDLWYSSANLLSGWGSEGGDDPAPTISGLYEKVRIIGAGGPNLNGVYTYNPVLGYYTYTDVYGTEFRIKLAANGNYELRDDGSGGTIYYYATSLFGAWTIVVGDSPAPTSNPIMQVSNVPWRFSYCEFWGYKDLNRTANSNINFLGFSNQNGTFIANQLRPGANVPFEVEENSPKIPEDLYAYYIEFPGGTVGDGCVVLPSM